VKKKVSNESLLASRPSLYVAAAYTTQQIRYPQKMTKKTSETLLV